MTFIQPEKNNGFLGKFLMILMVGLFSGAIWLVVLYNNTVNLAHGAAEMRTELQSVQSQNAEAENKMFTLLTQSASAELVKKDNLVQDKNPEYLETNSQWLYASHY